MTIYETLTIEEKRELIKNHPHRIKYFSNPECELALLAVQTNPNVLCLIRNQTEKVCLEAVKRNYCTVAYVRELTEKIVKAAMENDIDAKYYLPEDWYQKVKWEIPLAQ